jgi:hypothetical protein
LFDISFKSLVILLCGMVEDGVQKATDDA